MVGYILDIHAERAAAARAAASGRLAALGEMAAGLAHELKQPLAIISLAAENAARALRAGKPDSAAGRLDRIVAQAARAGELIEHLRRFARGAEAGAVPGPVPLRRAVNGALALVGASLRDADVALEVALGPPPGPLVMAELVPLEQVLANLIANARDAFAGRPPGGARRLRIGAEQEGGQVRITVADTAGGLPSRCWTGCSSPSSPPRTPRREPGSACRSATGWCSAWAGRSRPATPGRARSSRSPWPPRPTWRRPSRCRAAQRLKMWVPSISSTTTPSAARRPV